MKTIQTLQTESFSAESRQLDGTIISKNLPFLPTSFFQKIESFFHKETDELKKNLLFMSKRQLMPKTTQRGHKPTKASKCTSDQVLSSQLITHNYQVAIGLFLF